MFLYLKHSSLSEQLREELAHGRKNVGIIRIAFIITKAYK
jgi:hypothetical protein